MNQLGTYPLQPLTLSYRRDISLQGQTVNQLDRGRLLELIARVDLSRCFAKWVCDILAREESERAAEERDLATLFT